MNFAQMKKMEPRLAELETIAKKFDKKSCTISFWYREIKPPLLHHVGWGRADRSDPLATCQSYDTAYSYLYDLLPNCTAASCEDCIDARKGGE
jgi:hypothetical protein